MANKLAPKALLFVDGGCRTELEPSQRQAALQCVSDYAQLAVAAPMDELSQLYCRFFANWAIALNYWDSGNRSKAAKYYIKMDEVYRSKADWGRFQKQVTTTHQVSQHNLKKDLAEVTVRAAAPVMLTGAEILSDADWWGTEPTKLPPPEYGEYTRLAPLQRIPKVDLPLSMCEHCGIQSMHMLTCCRCKIATYCSGQCQRANWEACHRRTCSAWFPDLQPAVDLENLESKELECDDHGVLFMRL